MDTAGEITGSIEAQYSKVSGYFSLKKMLNQAKILILNKNEAMEIACKEKKSVGKISDLFKMLHKLGPHVVCVTDGKNGAFASNGDKILHAPIKKVRTVDASGEGDAFASGFLGTYFKKRDVAKSLHMGIANGANVVKYIGTTRGLLKK